MTALIAFFYTFSLVLRANIGKADNQFETVFSIPNPLTNFPLRNIEVDPQTEDIFVSGKNVLYKLSKVNNYEQIKTKSTGPKKDCFPEVDRQKYCGDDENSVMVVTPDHLITCSTLQGGLCRKRSKMNLNSSSDESNVGLVSNIEASAVGRLITVNVKTNSGSTNESRLLFAKSKTHLPTNIAGQMDIAAIFSVAAHLPIKSMRTGELDNKEAIFDMLLREIIADQTKMEYKAMLEDDDFVFLLFNQNSKAKIAKLCKSVDGVKPKRVYEDIPIFCYKNGTNFTQIEHGTFVSNSDSRYLVALFSNSEKSAAVCVFKKTDIFNKFLESRRNRYGTCPYISLNDAAFEQESVVGCQEWMSITEENEVLPGLYDAFNKGDFCNNVISPEYGVILGVLPMAGEALYTRDVNVTVVGSSVINDLIMLYVETQDGSVIKMYWDPNDMKTYELEEIKVDGSNIQAIRNVENEIYIMSELKIVKLLRKNCGDFSGSCQACMMAKDAHCGWCITSERCVERSECKNKTSYWLPSVRNQCLQLKFKYNFYGLNLDIEMISFLDVYFQPPLEGSDGMKCILNDEMLPSEPRSDQVRCTIDLTTRSAQKYAVGNQTLSILLNGKVLASTELVFYRCSIIDRCGECVEGGIKQCYWCVGEGSCTYAAGDCGNTKILRSSEKENCPQILSSEVKIPNGRKQRVTFTGRNLETSFKYSCLVNEVSYPGALSGNNISCEVEVSYEENKGNSDPQSITFKYALDSSAELKYDLDAFDGDPHLLAYKCEHLSSDKRDCSTCYYQNYIGYRCSHCGDNRGCTNEYSCSQPEPCKKPEITSFTLTDGTDGSGTEISIMGINLGVDVRDINVTVAGVNCENITLKNRIIKCITEISTVKSGSLIVYVNGKISAENFEYKHTNMNICLQTCSQQRIKTEITSTSFKYSCLVNGVPYPAALSGGNISCDAELVISVANLQELSSGQYACVYIGYGEKLMAAAKRIGDNHIQCIIPWNELPTFPLHRGCIRMNLTLLLDGIPIAFGSIDFFDSEVQNKSCSTRNCTVDGFWSSFGPFSNWSTCSQSCGGGHQNRTQYRTCTEPPSSGGGNDCEGPEHNTEIRKCNEQDCPVYGTWTDFQVIQNWTQCSVSCGEGKQSRIRLRNCIPSIVKVETETCAGSAFEPEIRACNTEHCSSVDYVTITISTSAASIVLVMSLTCTVCICYRRRSKPTKALSSHQTPQDEGTVPTDSHYNYITGVIDNSDHSVYEEMVDLAEADALSPGDTENYPNIENERETNETSPTPHQYEDLTIPSRECPYDALQRPIFSETITNNAI